MHGPEIAARTGLTHGSVSRKPCRGMQLLREKLWRDGARRIMSPRKKFMKDDYLWTARGARTGRPKLRRHWGAIATSTALRSIKSPSSGSEGPPPGPQRYFFLRFPFQLAAVAATLLVAGQGLLLLFDRKPIIDSGPGWEWLAWRAHPRLAGKVIGAKSARQTLPLGQTLITDGIREHSITLMKRGRGKWTQFADLRLVRTAPATRVSPLSAGRFMLSSGAPGNFRGHIRSRRRSRLHVHADTWTIPAQASWHQMAGWASS